MQFFFNYDFMLNFFGLFTNRVEKQARHCFTFIQLNVNDNWNFIQTTSTLLAVAFKILKLLLFARKFSRQLRSDIHIFYCTFWFNEIQIPSNLSNFIIIMSASSLYRLNGRFCSGSIVGARNARCRTYLIHSFRMFFSYSNLFHINKQFFVERSDSVFFVCC